MRTDSSQQDSHKILISWISEFAYCPRRFYLRVIEGQKARNIYMIEGEIEHESIHEPKIERRRDKVKVSGMSVFSHQYQILGICDLLVCEKSRYGAELPFLQGKYKLTPIEYKHGKVRQSREYEAQLSAQSICLEEMFNTTIESGYIYYYDAKEYVSVDFSEEKREYLEELLKGIRKELDTQINIEPVYKQRCRKCSVFEICNPKREMIQRYMKRIWELELKGKVF